MLVVQFLKEAWHSTYLSLIALVALFFSFCLMILFPYVNVLANYLDVKYFSNPSRRFIFCSLFIMFGVLSKEAIAILCAALLLSILFVSMRHK